MTKLTGTIIDNGFSTSFSGVNGEESVILDENLNGAKIGNNVEVENISDNPNLPVLKVIKVIDEVKNMVNEIIVEGIFRQTHVNYGFIDVPGERKGFFVKTSNNKGAKTGDKVKANLRKISGKDEAYVQEIVTSTKKQFKHMKEFLGDDYKAKSDVMKIAIEQGARIAFSSELLEEVDNIDSNIELSEIMRRKDHRDLFTITIDGPDSKDLDDAISIEQTDNGYKLYVHIADVTHYVNEGSLVEEEALERATSIYFTDKVIPMLPEKLSNDLCSLNPHTDKLTMTYEMTINADGSIDYDKSEIYESVINSNYRMTYKEVQQLSEGEIESGEKLMFDGIVEKDLQKITRFASTLAGKLNRSTKSEGELEFDFPETKVEVNSNGKAIGFKAYDKYESNDWIKAFMVAANDTSSYKMGDNPYIYRTHLKPKDQSVEKLQNILAVVGVSFDISDATSEKFVELLEHIKGHDKEKFLSKAILVTMQKATYNHEKQGHFGLAKDDYTHSTSPIRRYSDLIAHRITKEYLNGTLTGDRITHYNNLLEQVAEKCSIEEDKSEKIESEVNKYKSCEYMEDKIGEEFKGYISGISERGIFVDLENTIQGALELNKEDGYEFHQLCEGLYEVTDTHKHETYNVGDDLTISVKKVDKENRKIYFELV